MDERVESMTVFACKVSESALNEAKLANKIVEISKCRDFLSIPSNSIEDY